MHIQKPPWKSLLEQTIQVHQTDQKFTVQLATVNSRGRPECRNIVFEGFAQLNYAAFEHLVREAGSTTEGDPAQHSKLSFSKMDSVMTFFVDIRTIKQSFGVSRDTDSFGEVCWHFPHTLEQYRLAGRLFVVAEPGSVLADNICPPWTTKDMNWERFRINTWESLSKEEKFKYAGSAPGSPITFFHSRSEETIANIHEDGRRWRNESSINDVRGVSVGGLVGDISNEPLNSYSSTKDLDQDDSFLKQSLSNFGILLLDIDRVDYTDFSLAPAQRFVYSMRIPERTYGRISGLEWDVSRVNV